MPNSTHWTFNPAVKCSFCWSVSPTPNQYWLSVADGHVRLGPSTWVPSLAVRGVSKPANPWRSPVPVTSNAPRRSHLRCLRRWSIPPRSSTYLSCHGDRHTARESFHLPILATFPASFPPAPHVTSGASEGGCSDLWFSFFFLSLSRSFFYTKRLEGLDLYVGILKSRDNLKRTMRLFLFLDSY